MDSLGGVVFIKSNMNVDDFIDDQWTEKKTGRCTFTELQRFLSSVILTAGSQILYGLFKVHHVSERLPAQTSICIFKNNNNRTKENKQ